MASKPIHDELRELMRGRGWSPIELAAAADTTPATVSRYLNARRGRRIDPKSLRTYRSFERAFDLPQGYFLEEQLWEEHKELTRLVKAGLIRLPQLHALVVLGQREEELARGRGDQ